MATDAQNLRDANGGTSLRPSGFIPHSLPTLGPQDLSAVASAFGRRFVGYGSAAKALEARFCQFTGRPHVFAVLSGSHALAVSVRALDLPRNSLIVLPTLTCTSVLDAVISSGHFPFLSDVRDDDLTIDTRGLDRCAAVIAPHAYGAPVDTKAIAALGCPWIEDCATSPATWADGLPAGASGTLAIFSLSSTKYLTSGSGGIIVTSDDDLAARIEDLLAFDRADLRGRWLNGYPGGLPGRLSDLNACLAGAQMDALADFSSRRRWIAAAYDEGLRGIDELQVPKSVAGHSYFRYIVRTRSSARAITEQLHAVGIDARSSVNSWIHTTFAGSFCARASYPVADAWREHLLSLPIYPSLREDQLAYVVESVRKVVRQ